MGIQRKRGRFFSFGKLVGASFAVLTLTIQPLVTGNLPAALAAVGDSVYVATSGSGTVCTHAAPCATFANALAVVNDGGVVHVANGTYTENITVAKPVTLKTDHGRDNVTLNGSIMITHDGVTVRGFTVTNPGATYGVEVKNANNAVITSNAFTNVGSSYGGSSAVQAVYLVGTSSYASVDHNTFTTIGSTSNTSSNKAIFVGDSTSGPTANIAISYNTINGVSSTRGAYGLLVNHEATALMVTHNTISNLNGVWAHAVGLEANTPGAVVANNKVTYVTGGIDSVAYRYESNPGALTSTMTSDSFNGHQATNSASVVAVDPSWALYSTATATNTYPEVYFHGKYYYYGINAFATIPDAFSHVAAGGTVFVESGSYTDVRATGSYADNITVKGYSRPTINGLDLTGATFNGLTFQGFTFAGDANGYGNFNVGLTGGGSYQNLAFVGNIFDGQSIAGRGALFLNRGFDGLTLQNNTFKNYNGSAVGTVYSVVFVEAQSGTSGNNFVASGNKLRTSTATNFLEAYRWKNVTFDSNDVNATAGRLLVWSDDSFALDTVTITGNTVKVHQGTGFGVYYAPSTTTTVSGNTVDGAESCVKLDSVSDSSVKGNTFANCSVNGVKFSKSGATTPASAAISENDFSNGPVGVENTANGFAPAVCDNTFTGITTPYYSNPGPFNTVACQAPTLVAPANNAVVNGASVTNSWTAVPGATKYQYQSFNTSDTSVAPRWDHLYSGTSKTATNVADGTVFYWRVRAVDALGNVSPWSSLWKVTIDNAGPSIIITSIVRNSDNTYTIAGTTDDTADVAVSVDGGTAITTTPLSGNWTVTSGVLADGDHTVEAKSADAAGNPGSASAAFTQTTTPAVTGTGTELDNTENGDNSNGDGEVPTTRQLFTVPIVALGDQAVLGDEDATADDNTNGTAGVDTSDQDVKGTSDVKDENNTFSPFGLAWYWWLLILAVIAAIIAAIAARRRAAEES